MLANSITITYDIIHACIILYAQELMRAEGPKERPTQLLAIPIIENTTVLSYSSNVYKL